MTAITWESANFQMLSEPSDPKNAKFVVVPWSKFGTRRLYVDTADGQHVGWFDLKTGHRALAMPRFALAFELALSEALLAHVEDVEPAGDPVAPMRRAYRGRNAYSGWDLGACGKRLVEEENDHVPSLDAGLAYLDFAAVGN